jgi:alpha-tubulin suppressor-like RCC1 family protein
METMYLVVPGPGKRLSESYTLRQRPSMTEIWEQELAHHVSFPHRVTDAGTPTFSRLIPTVNNSVRSLAARSRPLAALVSVLAVALVSCKKDATGPLVAAKLAFTVQPTNTLTDSSIVPAIAVTVEDAAGDPVTTSSLLVTLALNTNPGGSVLSGSLTVAAVGGVATFPYISLNLPASGYSIVATATGVTSATSSTFNVTPATSGSFTSVAAGGNSTCGVATGGVGYCWGNNSFGQLGNSATTNSAIPIKVVGGLTFSSMTVGSIDGYACGLTTSGAAYCWGYNDYGQLGNGNFNTSAVPVAVTGNLTFTALSAGDGGQACGIAAGGAAYCWGYNGGGGLGSAAAFTSTPLPVQGGLVFASISAGQNGQTCALTPAGAAYCWGNGASGALGNGSQASTNTPVAVSGGLAFKSISAGYSSTCGLTTAGAAYCWGDNTYGELGNGSTTNSLTPVAVGGGLTFTAISVGDAFACGLVTSGAAYCWGFNGEGQLGVGASTRSTSPEALFGGVAFASISAGYSSACAVTPGGAAYCWGDNTYGQLGNQVTGGTALTPVLVVTPQ